MPNQPYPNFNPTPATVPVGPPADDTQQGSTPSSPTIPPSINNLAENQQFGFGLTVEWTTDMGLRSSPVSASPGAAPEQFWRCHAGSQWMIMSCISLSVIDPPMLPSPNTGDPNNVLMFWKQVLLLAPFADGNYLPGALLVLVYKLQIPKNIETDSFAFPANAKLAVPAGAVILSPQNYYSYLSQSSVIVGGQAVTW